MSPRLRKNARANRVCGDPAVAVMVMPGNNILLGEPEVMPIGHQQEGDRARQKTQTRWLWLEKRSLKRTEMANAHPAERRRSLGTTIIL